MNGQRQQRGSLLIAAVVIMVTLSLLVAVTSRLFVGQVLGNNNIIFAEQVLQLAESGLEKAKYELSQDQAYTGEVNTSFATGTFTTTILSTDFSGAALASDQRRIQSTAEQYAADGSIITRSVEAIITLPATSMAGFAAGQNGTLMEWDGSTWNDAQTPRRFNTDIEGAYCSSANNCWFVGLNGDIVHWDGTTLTTTSNTSRDLFDISCHPLNPAQCFAVGERGTIETWNGSSWSRSTSANGEDINGIHCLASGCYAVGDNGTIYHFDGSNWLDESIGGNTNLNAIHCLAADECWAVGNNRNNNFTIWQRNIGGWTDQSQYDRNNNEDLNGIACLPLSADCWAVGDNGTLLSFTGTLPWTLDNSPSRGNLLDVSCSSTAEECWAVGASNGGRRRRGRGRSNAPLHWLGGNWTSSSTSSPNRTQLSAIEYISGAGGSGTLTTSAWQELLP
jgi:Tfp pilus assembly protein PilX